MHKILAAFLVIFLMQAVCPAKDPPVVTDDTISDAVRVKLAGDQLVGVLSFEVTVKQGVVTLAGSVEQKSLRSRAEKVAKKVKGVKQVQEPVETLDARRPRPADQRRGWVPSHWSDKRDVALVHVTAHAGLSETLAA